jgi:hypothetical protein
MFLTETNGCQKLCDKNKNGTKMGMIIKGVYSSTNNGWMWDHENIPLVNQGMRPKEGPSKD